MLKIFISYSHKDEEWKDRLLVHLKVLSDVAIWHDRKIDIGDYWHDEILDAIENSDVAILLISANFLASDFIVGEEIPRFFQKKLDESLKIIPVLVKPCAWSNIDWLCSLQLFPRDNTSLSSGDEHKIEEDLTRLTLKIGDIINQKKKPIARPFNESSCQYLKHNIFRLPSTTNKFFGREKELQILENAQKNSDVNIFILIGWGGAGKTALINHWVEKLINKKNIEFESIYGWSFYSQGVMDSTQISSSDFFVDAFQWFKYNKAPPISSIDKGLALAKLISEKKALLILDGVEPLQNPSGDFAGSLKDKGLEVLIKQLST